MVDKITGPITPLDEIDKINEVIDNLGGGGTVDQTYDASSSNAQSGVAINGAKFIQNTATGSNALTVGGTASGYTGGTNIGVSSQAKQNYGTAIGYNTNANGNSSTCIGRNAGTSAASAIQIGAGINSTANTLQVGFIHASTNYQLLDGTTGKIPNDRIKYDGTTITVNSNGELTSTGGGGASRNIGEIVTSTTPLTDAGLHLLDGALISGSGSYSAFVTYIAGLVSTYPSLFISESAWQTSVSTYGVCGKFVYDSTNNTVRLPKYSNKIYTKDLASTAPVVGNGLAIGLTNGTSNAGLICVPGSGLNYLTSYGSAYGDNVSNTSDTYANPIIGNIGVTTDSSKSGIIAKLSGITTSLNGYYYIVVATSTKTDIQVDIDEIATDLNGKADKDLSNVPTSKGILTTSYKNGTSWYRVYSDGWCEQGGYIKPVSTSYTSITLLKTYKDANYSLQLSQCNYSGQDANYSFIASGNRTKALFQIIASTASCSCSWQACGYIR